MYPENRTTSPVFLSIKDGKTCFSVTTDILKTKEVIFNKNYNFNTI